MELLPQLIIISLFAFGLALVGFLYIFNRYRMRMGFTAHALRRIPSNPILSPLDHNLWEVGATFNPAAFQDNTGRVHVVYRAIGADGVSRMGYASSADGKSFDERLSYPVFAMQNPRQHMPALAERRYDYRLYPSGGSWGGSEDPRLVEIDGRVYMTFNAFDGWDFIRIGVASINSEDFKNKKWRWSRPILISPSGMINKNWVLFPQKFKGKFAILHGIAPTVQIDYVDKLEDLAYGMSVIKSKAPHGGRDGFWDTNVRGAGPPPIKTDKGWLVLYHAIDKHDPGRYKLGALLLDLKDPSKTIARSPAPLLFPDMWYENDGKPGVVYSCGAVVKDKKLIVYYGGGDKHVCVAETELDGLLDWLIRYGKV